MNEELLTYQILHLAGFDTEQLFEEELNHLFLEYPEVDKDLLEMECMSVQDAMRYLSGHFDYETMNQEKLQKLLILTLKKFYEDLPFLEFAGMLSGLWEVLPFHTSREDSPFYLTYYYDDLLSAGKYDAVKEDIEEMFSSVL